jgi:polyphosphate kinase
MVDKEIQHAVAGHTASIILKLNSLEDEVMIEKLYEASRAGVKIDIIVRGICCLVPGVKQQSENIRVISTIDRFLEHARIYVFHNGGAERYYLASADWMTRNLSRRVEVAFPVYDEQLQRELRDIIRMQLDDDVKGRLINADLDNRYVCDTPVEVLSAQHKIYRALQSGTLGKSV